MIPVADPGFQRCGGANLIFGIIFAENCRNMKKNCVEKGCACNIDAVLCLVQHVSGGGAAPGR